LYLHHILPRVALGSGDPKDFKHSLTLYVATNAKVDDAQKLGLKSDTNFIIADIPRGIAFVVGTPSTRAVQNALAAIASPRLLVDKEFIPLQANVVEVPKQGRPLLVFSPGNALRKKGVQLTTLTGGNVVWGNNGLYRMFDGLSPEWSKDLKLNRGDLVEDIVGKDGKVVRSRVTVRNAAAFPSYPHPSAIVVAVDDASGVLPAVSKVTPAGLRSVLLAGPTGNKDAPYQPLYADTTVADPKSVVDKLVAVANGESVNVYVVNLSPKTGNLSSDDVTKILTAIGDGTAANASTLSGVFSNLAPITSLSGVTANIDPSKGNSDAYKQAATKFDNDLNEFVTKQYPN
jgi:hypothetical protein